MVDYRIPVTIITGFLGAGKTTLLNKLIAQNKFKKFAIIENEFGEINIDSDLIVNVDNNNIFELSNGCICCSLNDDLLGVLNNLLDSEKPFHHLIIETTGIADPSSVIYPFISDYDIQQQFRLDGVVCLVDAVNISDILKAEQEATKQIALADIIILNKKSDVSAEFLQNVKSEIFSINQFSEVIETDFAELRDKNILDLQVMTPEGVAEYVEKVKSVNNANKSFFKHIQNVQAHSFVIDGEIDYDNFSRWVDFFMLLNQNTLYRIKGILAFEGSKQKMIAQSVKTSFLMTEGELWDDNEIKKSQIVIIGKNLDKAKIEENLKQLVVLK